MRAIVIIGGVLSGIGKGTIAGSISRILKEAGLSVIPIKVESHLNVDASSIGPYEHGEVYILGDGTEGDLDLGTYERLLGEDLDWRSYLTAGEVIYKFLKEEREGRIYGRIFRLVPDISEKIKDEIKRRGSGKDVVVIEIGGIIEEVENFFLMDAIRRLRKEVEMMIIHVSYSPSLGELGENRIEPVEGSVYSLRYYGLDPDLLIIRSENPIDEKSLEEVKRRTGIKDVISIPKLSISYEMPVFLVKKGINKILERFLKRKIDSYPKFFEDFSNRIKNGREIKVLIAGKYVRFKDAYESLIDAVYSAASHLNLNPKIIYVDTTKLDEIPRNFDCIIVGGGVGKEGTEGMIKIIKYSRERKIPVLGICFGMQFMVVEFARNVLGLKDANTTEVDPKTKNPVVDIIFGEREQPIHLSFRKGIKEVLIKKGTKLYEVYEKDLVFEKHRHKYGVNLDYVEILEKNGMKISAYSRDGKIAEAVELEGHPFFVGVQYHPEYRSKPEKPHPIFISLLKNSIK